MEHENAKIYKNIENNKYCFCKSSKINYLKEIVNKTCKICKLKVQGYNHKNHMCHIKKNFIVGKQKKTTTLLLWQGQLLNNLSNNKHSFNCEIFLNSRKILRP